MSHLFALVLTLISLAGSYGLMAFSDYTELFLWPIGFAICMDLGFRYRRFPLALVLFALPFTGPLIWYSREMVSNPVRGPNFRAYLIMNALLLILPLWATYTGFLKAIRGQDDSKSLRIEV